MKIGAAISVTELLRAALLQDEIAPKKCSVDTKNGLKNAQKDPKNDPKRDQKMSSHSQAAYKYFTGTFSKSVSPPKIRKMKSLRGSAGVAMLKISGG